tara:strand:- start:31 stop:300 length:270 start_codon:yes stop_codon:yes gene_type:complete
MLTGVWVRIIIGLNEEIKYYKIMGHYEDIWYEIHDDITNKGLKVEFDAQLEKMNGQDKHKYKESRERWEYAHKRVISLPKNISNKKALN